MCASSPQADPNFFYFSDQIVSKGKAEGREQGISESEMASGWGISGNKGRCYDFWNEFSECMSRCREPKECTFLREDYFECLHHAKEVIPQIQPLFSYYLLMHFSLPKSFA
ncbi:hypothetical protein ZIOFF_022459 [Zingiber officinale]|uniref:NADH dehydrogenase [ubiquinone] iron-sulfur protein 5 n=1 Tax=Zingiber officinale TaxID=94328 RepID=A0A8J5LK58_ZINOF|nr:hypothetical protein ZIOFF_022459 [Zingiber officinale]